MDFLWVLLWMAIVAVLLCYLLAWTYPHYLLRYEFPFAICYRIIARLTENTIFMALRLDYTAWKMGLCNHHTVTRFLCKGFPIFKQDPKLHITQSRFDGVPVKLCQPRGDHTKHQRGILFFHGGIGIWNVINIYERVCRYLARESASFVVSVEYRLAPEHPYPAQFEDCLKATIHLLKNAKEYGVDPDCIVISGDSSGATLAAAVCQELVKRTDLPKVRAQILLHPFLQAKGPLYSFAERMSDFETPSRPTTLPLPMAPVKPRRGRSKYGLMRSLSYSPPSSLKNGQDLDSCATPEGVTVETENRDPQEVEWESESREPPGTALKQRNRKQQLRSRTNRLKNHLWELDPESLKRRLWNLRGENQYPPIPETPQEYQCADQRCWMCDDCETPWPSSPTEAYLRDVSVTSAAEGQEL